MRDLLRKVPFAGEVYRSARAALNMPARQHYDTLAALERLAERAASESGTTQMPWGAVEYTSVHSLLNQFDEIFVQRQYAASIDSAAPVIVDCGGNIGLSAIFFRQEFPAAQITVYEADHRLAATLSRNLANAGITDVTVWQKAVWTANGTVPFEGRGDDKGRVARAGTTTIPAVDLAEALPPHVDLLKMDVEGAEFDLVDHLCTTGAIARVERMVCEFHVTPDDTERFFQSQTHLRHAGFEWSMTARLADWTGPSSRVSPFEAVGRNNAYVVGYAWRTK